MSGFSFNALYRKRLTLSRNKAPPFLQYPFDWQVSIHLEWHPVASKCNIFITSSSSPSSSSEKQPSFIPCRHWKDVVKSKCEQENSAIIMHTSNSGPAKVHVLPIYASDGGLLYRANSAQFIQCTFRCFNLDYLHLLPTGERENRLEWVLNCADLIKHFSDGLCCCFDGD